MRHVLPIIVLVFTTGCDEYTTPPTAGCPSVIFPAFQIGIRDVQTDENLLCEAFVSLQTPLGNIDEYLFAELDACQDEGTEYINIFGRPGLYDIRVEVADYEETYLQDVLVTEDRTCDLNRTVRLNIEMIPDAM